MGLTRQLNQQLFQRHGIVESTFKQLCCTASQCHIFPATFLKRQFHPNWGHQPNSLSLASTEAVAPSSTSTMSTWPDLAAMCSGSRPGSAWASMEFFERWCTLNRWPPVAEEWNIREIPQGGECPVKAFNYSSELRLTISGCNQICFSYSPSRDLRGGSAAQLQRCHGQQPHRCPRLGATAWCRKRMAGDLAEVFQRTSKNTTPREVFGQNNNNRKNP